MIWTLIIDNISKIGLGIMGAFSMLMYGKNKKLAQEKTELQETLAVNDKIIDIQQKVIDVTQNTKPTDLDGNLERMRGDKL